MIYSAQSVDWKSLAKEKLRNGKERFPRFKQLIIFIVTFIFFWLVGIWFKSNFERIGEENESYELKREIQ
jgi:cathepsin L